MPVSIDYVWTDDDEGACVSGEDDDRVERETTEDPCHGGVHREPIQATNHRNAQTSPT